MTNPTETTIVLDVHEWLDAPDDALEKLKSVASETVTIDASSSVEIGAQIAQLLVSAHKTALAGSGKLQIINATPTVTESLEKMGLTDFFEGVLL